MFSGRASTLFAGAADETAACSCLARRRAAPSGDPRRRAKLTTIQSKIAPRLGLEQGNGSKFDTTQGVRYNVPTVIREEGFEARIYTFDHPPPHVHVAKAGAIVRIDLATHEVTEIVGDISDRDVKRAERLVARHAKRLKEEWAKIHGND